MTPQFRAGMLAGFAVATIVWVLYFEWQRKKTHARTTAKLDGVIQGARGYPGYNAMLPTVTPARCGNEHNRRKCQYPDDGHLWHSDGAIYWRYATGGFVETRDREEKQNAAGRTRRRFAREVRTD